MNPTATAERAESLAKYEQDGYAIFRNVIDRDLIQEASDHIAWLLETNPGYTPELLTQDLITNDPFWVRLISDDRLLDIAEMFIGPNIDLFASHYLVKPAFTGKLVKWHQDAVFWPLEPMEVVTLWLAIDESTTENGCVRLIPGTHKTETDLSKMDIFEIDKNGQIGGRNTPEVDESKAVDMVLQPGDVEVHHPMMFHASNANTSPKRRAGLTIRYIPSSTRVTSDLLLSQCVFNLRGESGVNKTLPFPTYKNDGTQFPFKDSKAWS